MGTAAKPTREHRTITVDFQNETSYFQLLGDGKAFLECVLAFVMSLGFQLTHKATCGGGGCLTPVPPQKPKTRNFPPPPPSIVMRSLINPPLVSAPLGLLVSPFPSHASPP